MLRTLIHYPLVHRSASFLFSGHFKIRDAVISRNISVKGKYQSFANDKNSDEDQCFKRADFSHFGLSRVAYFNLISNHTKDPITVILF